MKRQEWDDHKDGQVQGQDEPDIRSGISSSNNITIAHKVSLNNSTGYVCCWLSRQNLNNYRIGGYLRLL